MKRTILLVFILFNSFFAFTQRSDINDLDVIEYKVSIEPFFSKQYIEGSVNIKFRPPLNSQKVTFDSGDLTVTKIEGEAVKGFIQKGKKTIITLAPNTEEIRELSIFYNGKPKRGLLFLDDSKSLYTVYFTGEWMVCNASPNDRASLKLDILVPKGLMNIASGELIDTTTIRDKVQYSWQQDYETPAYTYGFTIGSFNSAFDIYKGRLLKYYSDIHTEEELKIIFQYTSDMMAFFEEKSGIRFPQGIYSQVLIGQHYQEMSGFSVLRASYGKLILQDSTETNLISHELAHQWWGNMITCKSWNHFWLNEGFATFMSAAYNEHRFGKEKYQSDINAYFEVYHKIKQKGKDKSLVFNNWLNPSKDDRNLVYFKGAYVLHLLKEKLGDEVFWKGIKYYTQTYYRQFVTTKDFQFAMEKSSGQSLTDFFAKWVY
jgi:aminopeptidase N